MEGVTKREVIQFAQDSGYANCDKGNTIKVKGESTTAYEEFSGKFGYECIKYYKRRSPNDSEYVNYCS
ncbi:hypothetical protein Lalb_Chr19g0134781 [Lupinus albus]|uniref:Uncharacterized protein n=1 Tax=Lupinus albus TaxID=3870 RepID=A0A6A4NH02_LUPAL|nr:hypothetical protein Lalb_Chr19g0134781 [Lupinus albus]